eukprot:NODE_5309_length_586_cov_98.132216_g4598_i0.p4 GENE.NODE_5309_length_586_cov_98.132216_g4598_i0~~NODE_5309_length_586_cov_98.132216_g4598_i0.p4  ORF type:complete len:63 (+),score=15.98 NODE_5309_length_586_cov_98.132216_g4598_i0:29-190(+)
MHRHGRKYFVFVHMFSVKDAARALQCQHELGGSKIRITSFNIKKPNSLAPQLR